MLKRAAEIDLGFDLDVLARMMRSHERFDDDQFFNGVGKNLDIRAFFDRWSQELSAN